MICKDCSHRNPAYHEYCYKCSGRLYRKSGQKLRLAQNNLIRTLQLLAR